MRTKLLLFFVACGAGMSQVSTPRNPIAFVAAAPNGACVTGSPLQYVTTTGALYGCVNSAWASIVGSALISDLQGTATATVATQAAGSAMFNGITSSIGSGTITKTGGTDTGTFRTYVDYNSGSPVLKCVYGTGLTISNYTVSSGFSGSTCTSSNSIPTTSVVIPLTAFAITAGAFSTSPTDLRSAFDQTAFTCSGGLSQASPYSCTVDTTSIPQKFSGSGTPGSVAASLLGDLYVNTATGDLYICTASPGPCTAVAASNWVKVGSGSSGAAGAVQLSDGSGGFTADATRLLWSTSNRRLGICYLSGSCSTAFGGGATPLVPLHIAGDNTQTTFLRYENSVSAFGTIDIQAAFGTSVQFGAGANIGYVAANGGAELRPGTRTYHWDSDGVKVGYVSGANRGWTSSATDGSGALDTGLARSAAGRVQANTGTVGTFGNFELAGLFSHETTAPSAVSGKTVTYADSTQHELLVATNGSSSFGMLQRVMPGAVHQTGQTGAIATATLCAASAGACNVAGNYAVSFVFTQTGTACGTASPGAVTFDLTWTDSNGTAHTASLPMEDASALSTISTSFHFASTHAAAYAGGTFNFSSNGSVIQYATQYTACTSGTGSYTLDAAVVRTR